MHIADGIIPAGVSLAAQGVAMTCVYGMGRNIEGERISRMGMVSAAAFVASLIHFPLGGTSVHLGLFGLIGILLGRHAFPVVFATLLFQALVFQHGGLLTLGVNALNMGAGSILGWQIWRMGGLPDSARAFAAGFAGILLPALLMATEFSMFGYGKGLYYISAIYTVTAALEGAITVSVVAFFRRVKPEILAHV